MNAQSTTITSGAPVLDPTIRLSEYDREYELEVHVPGYVYGRICVEIDAERNRVTARGERRGRRDASVVESRFEKTFEFDRSADVSGMRHCLSNGILVLVVPKVSDFGRGPPASMVISPAEEYARMMKSTGLEGDELAVAVAISEIGRKLQSAEEEEGGGATEDSRAAETRHRRRAGSCRCAMRGGPRG